MKSILFFLLVIPAIALGADATVNFTLTGETLTVTYTLPDGIEEVSFSDENLETLKKIFPKFSKKVTSGKLVLETIERESLLRVEDTTVFSQDNGNTLIYSLGFDVSHGLRNNEVVLFDNLIFQFNGKILHTRKLEESGSFEKYLILENSPDDVYKGKHADILLDLDLVNRDHYLNQIEKSLSYLNEKLGPPPTRPVIFFTYSSSDEPWYDGRVVMGSPVVMMAISKGLEKEKVIFDLVLHHGLFSHEIAHHWNARNLKSDYQTQDEADRNNWVHEGAAEAMAHLMTNELFSDELGPYVSYMRENNLLLCESPDEDADWGYNCGDAMYAKAMDYPGVDPWTVMREVLSLPVAGEDQVLKTLEKFVSPVVFEEIQKIHSSYKKP